MPHRRPPRLPAFEYKGPYRYFVTCCTFARERFFTTDDPVELVRSQILRTCRERDFALLADIYMPDHIHLLVEGRSDEADFKRLMMVLRQRAAVAFKARTGKILWQDGYFERVLRKEEDTGSVVEYLAHNPVRAGLVETIADYPYLWSQFGYGRETEETDEHELTQEKGARGAKAPRYEGFRATKAFRANSSWRGVFAWDVRTARHPRNQGRGRPGCDAARPPLAVAEL